MIRINVKTLVLIAMAICLCGSIHAQKMRKKTQLLYEKIIRTYNWGKPWMTFDEYAMQKKIALKKDGYFLAYFNAFSYLCRCERASYRHI